MSWLPPRSFAARAEWSRTHPWLAGCYFGFVMSALSALVFAVRGAPWFGLTFGLVMGPLTALLFAILAKRRFGERADADEQPPPTLRRMWSRASDRFLGGMMTLGVLGGMGSIIALALPGRSTMDVVGLVAGAWLATSTRAERKLRQGPARPSSA